MVVITQSILWLPTRMVAPLFVRKSQSLWQPTHINRDRPLIISSNHQCRMDHFLVLSSLPWRAYFKLMPYRFFTANDLFFFPLNIILLLCGSFPAFQHKRLPYGLRVAEQLLLKSQTIFIFPEGKRSPWRGRPARSGVAVLAQNVDCDILPASVLWHKRGWIRQCSVVIGQPVSAQNLTAQKILDLSFKLGKHHRI